VCITTGKRENISLSNLMVQVSLLFYYRVRPPLPSKYDLGLILPIMVRYQVIITQKIMIMEAGCVNSFSREFYQEYSKSSCSSRILPSTVVLLEYLDLVVFTVVHCGLSTLILRMVSINITDCTHVQSKMVDRVFQ